MLSCEQNQFHNQNHNSQLVRRNRVPLYDAEAQRGTLIIYTRIVGFGWRVRLSTSPRGRPQQVTSLKHINIIIYLDQYSCERQVRYSHDNSNLRISQVLAKTYKGGLGELVISRFM